MCCSSTSLGFAIGIGLRIETVYILGYRLSKQLWSLLLQSNWHRGFVGDSFNSRICKFQSQFIIGISFITMAMCLLCLKGLLAFILTNV